MEFILMQRKPGGYRQPTEKQREISKIPKDEFREWTQQTWTLTGASTRHRPAPFPYEIADRLIKMFSFVGDTVVDPFCGTGTTMLATIRNSRNSIGVEIDCEYCELALKRLHETETPFENTHIEFRAREEVSARKDVSESKAAALISETRVIGA